MALANPVNFSFATGGGSSDAITLRGPILLQISNCPTGATATVEHSIDDGASWVAAASDSAGTLAAFTSVGTFIVDMPVSGVRTRITVTGAYSDNCTGAFGA